MDSLTNNQTHGSFRVGLSLDRNKRFRRTMEDTHIYISDFGGIAGQGYFAIFDGHAGKKAAEWCGNHLHEIFLEMMRGNPTNPVPEIFCKTFLETDRQLEANDNHSGCTAITMFLHVEDGGNVENSSIMPVVNVGGRTLFAANVGDAKAVLCRNGKAIRLSYDHKTSDPQEAKRIASAGGFIINNRVNSILAVTRSLGDGSMKDFVVGSPDTTEVTVCEQDLHIILACDGLWDVCSEQEAVDMIADIEDPQEASDKLLDYALGNFSTDNLSVMVIRLYH
ncbi:protein phosphatase 2C [Basidiobolus meristosporus CBS 931.73]|uniref:Protein phosphatase 2C n=1 Tax=Basidiobolus meristosporus CBS 931.73 TaxID=1314790 RepID=A0A1Y1YG20_9FUNG|nr:protein phosphatase 2C [Basidiobolus meristosporus CBS 931.73]|eukprot:ORX96564.1 protein phosphatase 2C [Basidiobolus meristosporus CBS 931.73]